MINNKDAVIASSLAQQKSNYGDLTKDRNFVFPQRQHIKRDYIKISFIGVGLITLLGLCVFMLYMNGMFDMSKKDQPVNDIPIENEIYQTDTPNMDEYYILDDYIYRKYYDVAAELYSIGFTNIETIFTSFPEEYGKSGVFELNDVITTYPVPGVQLKKDEPIKIYVYMPVYENRVMVTEVAQRINIRSYPSTSADIIGIALAGEVYTVYESVYSENYNWLRIGQDMWIATEETWVEFLPSP